MEIINFSIMVGKKLRLNYVPLVFLMPWHGTDMVKMHG